MISSALGLGIKATGADELCSWYPEKNRLVYNDLIVNYSRWTNSEGLDPTIQHLAVLPNWTRYFAEMEWN